LAVPRLQVPSVTWLWLFGLALAVLSSLSSACYRVYFKLLLENGLSRSAIIFFRLAGTTLVPGIIMIFWPEQFRPDLLVQTAIVGVLGFALPLFLVLTILQRIALGNYAILLFSVPAITYLLSSLFGYGQFYATDLLAALLIFAAVAVHEVRSAQHSET
jgi:drug/metabolite transporter (DMT)-like permease